MNFKQMVDQNLLGWNVGCDECLLFRIIPVGEHAGKIEYIDNQYRFFIL